jgi:hypothetical protein
MFSRLKTPSPAMVLAFVALFAALAGGAIAAKTVKKNTVASKSIRAGAVTGPKIRANAVTSDKIADGAVTNADLAGGTSASLGAGFLSGHSNLTAVATEFYGPTGSESVDNASTEANVQELAPTGAAVTIRSLDVRLAAVVPAGSRKFTLRKDGTDTALTCTINAGSASCGATGSVTLNPGGFYAVKVENTGAVTTADASTAVRWTAP